MRGSLGATRPKGQRTLTTVTVGGETTLPFLHFGGPDSPPGRGRRGQSRRPGDWSPLLLEAWGDVAGDRRGPRRRDAGADLILLTLDLATVPPMRVLRSVLGATGLAAARLGPGQAEKDNEAGRRRRRRGQGERLVIGVCEGQNYRTIVAAALAPRPSRQLRARPWMSTWPNENRDPHRDMGMPIERIIMDPSTGALGYGIEYGYSVMERLRLAALQGDSMTQQPMLVTPGGEAWKTRRPRSARACRRRGATGWRVPSTGRRSPPSRSSSRAPISSSCAIRSRCGASSVPSRADDAGSPVPVPA